VIALDLIASWVLFSVPTMGTFPHFLIFLVGFELPLEQGLD